MYYIGIDIGGTNIKIGLISKDWEIVKICKFPTGSDPMKTITDELDSIFKEFKVTGIGVGVAGIVDKEGNVIQAANIPSLNNYSLGKELKERYNVDVKIENDANVATIAEALFGEGRGISNFIILTLGTGIGGSLWLNGQIAKFPMEVGHMSINFQGKSCSCGGVGCLEVYASARAIKDSFIEKLENGEDSQIKEFYEGNFYKATSLDIYKAAMEGDNVCRNVLKEAGKALGAGMANLINIFAPEKIVLTGGLSQAVNIYIETAIQEAKKRVMKGLSDSVKITLSNLVDSGGVLGAVSILRNQ